MIALFLAMAAAGTGCGREVASDAGLGDGNNQEIVFPVQDASSERFEALLTGRLILHEQCLYVKSNDSADRVLPIWPEGYSVKESGGGPATVHDEEGEPVATVGDAVSMGGGSFEKGDGSLDPALLEGTKRCRGPYWIVGDLRETK